MRDQRVGVLPLRLARHPGVDQYFAFLNPVQVAHAVTRLIVHRAHRLVIALQRVSVVIAFAADIAERNPAKDVLAINRQPQIQDAACLVGAVKRQQAARQRLVVIGVLRFQLNSGFQELEPLLRVAELRQCPALRHPGVVESRVQLERLIVIRYRFFVAIQVVKGISDVVDGDDVFRVDFERLLVELNG